MVLGVGVGLNSLKEVSLLVQGPYVLLFTYSLLLIIPLNYPYDLIDILIVLEIHPDYAIEIEK